MNDILLKITNGDTTLAQACNHLVYPAAYAPGDSITMTVPEPGYYVIRLDDAMNEEFVYMKETSFTLKIPFAEARISYSPRAFSGPMHYLSARSAQVEEIAAPRNLARNAYDCHGNTTCYPTHGPMWKRGGKLFLPPAMPLMASSAPKATVPTLTKAGASTVIRKRA